MEMEKEFDRLNVGPARSQAGNNYTNGSLSPSTSSTVPLPIEKNGYDDGSLDAEVSALTDSFSPLAELEEQQGVRRRRIPDMQLGSECLNIADNTNGTCLECRWVRLFDNVTYIGNRIYPSPNAPI